MEGDVPRSSAVLLPGRARPVRRRVVRPRGLGVACARRPGRLTVVCEWRGTASPLPGRSRSSAPTPLRPWGLMAHRTDVPPRRPLSLAVLALAALLPVAIAVGLYAFGRTHLPAAPLFGEQGTDVNVLEPQSGSGLFGLALVQLLLALPGAGTSRSVVHPPGPKSPQSLPGSRPPERSCGGREPRHGRGGHPSRRAHGRQAGPGTRVPHPSSLVYGRQSDSNGSRRVRRVPAVTP